MNQKLQLPNVTLVCIGSDHLSEAKFAIDTCTNFCDFGEVLHLTDVIDNNNNPHQQYNNFVVNKLHKLIKTSHLLIIQWDGFILNPIAWSDDFYKYDYIGARSVDGILNGGFSFRSKYLMREVAKLRLKANECMPEDLVITKRYKVSLQAVGCKFAPYDICDKFSVEINGFNQMARYTNQFGFHNIYTPSVQDYINVLNLSKQQA